MQLLKCASCNIIGVVNHQDPRPYMEHICISTGISIKRVQLFAVPSHVLGLRNIRVSVCDTVWVDFGVELSAGNTMYSALWWPAICGPVGAFH